MLKRKNEFSMMSIKLSVGANQGRKRVNPTLLKPAIKLKVTTELTDSYQQDRRTPASVTAEATAGSQKQTPGLKGAC